MPHSGKGKNALDFHLSFYLGYVAAKHPSAHLVVVANDKGYDSMIDHTRLLGFTAKRVGFKAKRAPAVKKAAPARQPAVAKKAAEKVAPVAKSAPAKKTPANKVPAAKAATSNAPAKKTAAKVATPDKKTALPKPVVAAEAKEFDRIRKGLAKMGDKRPHKLKSFLRHVESMLGKASTPAAVEAVVQKLEQEKVVRIAGDVVLYG